MTRRMRARANKRRSRIVFGAACLAGLAVAAVALGNTVIYANHFSHRHDVKSLNGTEGKRCDRKWREKAKTMAVTVKRGPTSCGYRPPIVGDSDLPDHALKAVLKIRKQTPKSLRDDAYVALRVRDSKRAGYELRVFPKSGKWRLLRDPAGGNFPFHGSAKAIRRINRANDLTLHAKGGQITAFANGKRLTKVNDPNPEDVTGRRLRVIIGNSHRSRKDVVGTVDDLRVAVP